MVDEHEIAQQQNDIAGFYGEKGDAPPPLEPFDYSTLFEDGEYDKKPEHETLPLENPFYVHPHLGAFVKSEGESWAANKRFIEVKNLGFNPQQYAYFDQQILKYAGDHVAKILMNGDAKFEPLRTNIAVMRNYLFNQYFPDGTEDRQTGDRGVKYVSQMGKEIGLMLKRGNSLISSPLEPSVSLNAANVEAHGGADIYLKLKAKSDRYAMGRWINAPYNLLAGKDPQNWELPPLADTPFGKINMVTNDSDPEYIDYNYTDMSAVNAAEAAAQQELYARLMARQDLAALAALGAIEEGAEGLGDIQTQLNTVEDLNQEVQQEAIAEARNILDKLRVHFAEFSVAQLLDNFDQPIVQELFDKMTTVGDTFHHHLEVAMQLNEDIEDNELVRSAIDALGILEYHALNHDAAQCRDSAIAYEAAGNMEMAATMHQRSSALIEEANQMPDAYKSSNTMTVGQLLDKVERGLDAVVEQVQDITQTQNQLGKSNELALGLRQLDPTATAAKENKVEPAKEEAKDPNKKDIKIDTMQAVRASMLRRQQERKEQMDRATGKEKEKAQAQTARGSRRSKSSTSSHSNAKKFAMANLVADVNLDAIKHAHFDSDDVVKPFNIKDMVREKAHGTHRNNAHQDDKKHDPLTDPHAPHRPTGKAR
jgi:hypothetical protein